MSQHKLSRVAVEIAKRELDQLIAITPGVKNTVLTTADGFEVSGATAHGAAADGKLAAIVSSIHSLGAAIATETGIGICQNVTVEGLGGVILLVEVPNQKNGLLLAVVAKQDAVLGHLLWSTKACAGRIAHAFSGHS
jgi:predicted regulator of Ras-like GTPase activity (Roadblock/LC7/MglB family)